MSLPQTSQIARDLMDQYGLNDWTFAFDRAVKRFGHTTYDAKLITMSAKLTELNDEARVKNTILHEIAHALVGRGSGHNYTWRLKARQIGCDAQRAYNPASTETPTLNYSATCACNVEFKRVRKPRGLYRCNRCLTPLVWKGTK